METVPKVGWTAGCRKGLPLPLRVGTARRSMAPGAFGYVLAFERNRYNPDPIETNGHVATGFKEAKTSHIKQERLIYVEH